MLHTLITSGAYTFVGTIGELKKIFKKPEVDVVRDGMCCGLRIYRCYMSFEYNGERHTVHIMKDFLKDDVLYLEYKGC